MKISDKTRLYIYQLSALLILFSSVFFSVNPFLAPFLLGIGSLGFVVGVFLNPYKGNSLRGRRLFTIQVFGALFMVAAAFFMYFNLKYWVMCLLIGALLTLYTGIMLPKVLKKEENSQK